VAVEELSADACAASSMDISQCFSGRREHCSHMGRNVNKAILAAKDGMAGLSAYSAASAGVIAFAKTRRIRAFA
jgi:hypothetical protein